MIVHYAPVTSRRLLSLVVIAYKFKFDVARKMGLFQLLGLTNFRIPLYCMYTQ